MCKQIQNPEINNSPALRISNVVYGRERREDGRVTYLLNGNSDGTRAIPEEIVAKRWRTRKQANKSFKGFRLSPNFWRAIGVALGKNAEKIKALKIEDIEFNFNKYKVDLQEKNYKIQSASNVIEVFKSLETQQLQSILDRHLDPNRIDKYGTPDLFLYISQTTNYLISMACFVEVKRPKEQLSNDQKHEINFLRNIGLKSRVLRLSER